jgi:hypothetical protein
MRKEALERKELDVRWEKLKREEAAKVHQDFSEQIEQVKEKLKAEKVRVIPIATSELSPVLELPEDMAKQQFIESLKHGLKILGCRLLNEEAAKQGLEQDRLNNDIPIFYLHPERGDIFYHDQKVAERRL